MDATVAHCGAARLGRTLLPVAVALALGGCAAMRSVDTPRPPVELMSAGELLLPRDCAAVPGAVYRTLFDVQPDGRVASPRSAEGSDGCVQQALREWVATFTYAPLEAVTPVAFDWMAVTASRHSGAAPSGFAATTAR